GNFAKVKLAKHKLTGAEVAVKVIDKTTLDEKKLGKLYREVRIMKTLHHPHIVKLYEVIETKYTVFLVMEYASGGELYDYLVVHGKMKEKEARAKFRQILSAVSYCHKKRVIHRDLKAENLLLDSNLDIKIADFGFSNYFDPDGKLDTFCGSPPYAAPELFQGRRYTGPEVDIWSLGVILYVLTTGCLPFDGKNLQEMRESVCRGKYRIPFYLSDGCEKLLRKFLIRDPYKRASLEILIDDPWINEGHTDSPIQSDLSTKIDEDDSVIRMMEAKYRIDRDTIVKSLRENLYDDVAAIYYHYYYEKENKLSPTSSSSPTPLAVKTNGPPQATPRDDPQSAMAALPTQAPRSAQKSASPQGSKSGVNNMSAIDEDSVLPPVQQGNNSAENDMASPLPSGAKSLIKAKPRKRRFTVGGEADMQKLADDDEDGAEMLRNLQNQPKAKDDGVSNVAVASALPAKHDNANQNNPLPSVGESQEANNVQAGAVDVQQTRKRHNTIVGLLRNTMRRPSDVANLMPILPLGKKEPTNDQMAAIPGSTTGNNGIGSANTMESSSSTFRTGDDGQPRSLRFTFNSNTTSTKPPEEII
ncbi:Serine/threonine-protein kinase par-1, partial [Chytridiales sp. JEL 0842]